MSKFLPSDKMPKPSKPIDAGKVAFVGRVRQQTVAGGKGNPIRKSPIIPNDNLLDRPAIHRNKTDMLTTNDEIPGEGY